MKRKFPIFHFPFFLCAFAFQFAFFIFHFSFALSSEDHIFDAHKTALSYLQLPLSARSAGLSGAGIACGDDAASAFFNPALISYAPNPRLSMSGEKLEADRSHYFAGLAYPLRDSLTALGMGFVHYGVDDFERRDENGYLLGYFKDQENTLAFWYGAEILPALRLGLAAKLHLQTLDDEKAKTASFDLGLVYQPWHRMHMGFSCRNLGPKLKWSTGEEDPVVPVLRGGISVAAWRKEDPAKIRIMLDAEDTWLETPQAHLGAEASVLRPLVLRLGAEGPNPLQYSGGFGVRYGIISADYSFTYHTSGLGHSHLVSLVIDIKRTYIVKAAEPPASDGKTE